MDKSTSLYLDFCRITAALFVFFHHYFKPPFYAGDLRFNLGREAVVIFFVISGFVIAYVTDRGEASVRSYAIDRASRLYSVVIPALLLTLVLDTCVQAIRPELLDQNAQTWPALRILASLIFINQSWNLTIAALSNGPFWSLCYEFWYYVIYGLFIYSPKKLRYRLVALAMLLAGPRIILLFPVWLIGVGVYKLRSSIADRRLVPWLFPACFGLFLFLMTRYLHGWEMPGLDTPIRFLSTHLDHGYFVLPFGYKIFIGSDAFFLADYLLGVSFASTLITCESFFSRFAIRPWLAKTIRVSGSYTFSIYLYHVPFLIFFAALVAADVPEPIRGITLIVSTLFGVWLLGTFTEQRKHLFKSLFSRMVDRI
jgi:peptidoglycan/LPS O-acetylase OafA/YrhL